MDGASALLHLLRASIQKLQDDDVFGMHCQVRCLKESALQADGRSAAVYPIQRRGDEQSPICEPSGSVGRDHCRSLGNVTVVKIKRTFILLHHKVQQLFRVLEQIVDYQEAASMVDASALEFHIDG